MRPACRSPRSAPLALPRRCHWSSPSRGGGCAGQPRAVLVSDSAQLTAFDSVFSSVFSGREPSAGFRRDHGVEPAAERATEPDAGGETERGCGGRRPPRRVRGRDDDLREVTLPVAASDEERLRDKRFDALEPRELAQLYRLMARLVVSTPKRRTPFRASAARRAHGHATHPARKHAHGEPDPPCAPPPARGSPAHGDAVRHLGFDGAVRARVPAVPDLGGRQRAERRGVRIRHAADAPDPSAAFAQPGARDPARRGGCPDWSSGAHRRRTTRRINIAMGDADGSRRGGGDPVRWLGAGRSRARRPRDGAPLAWRTRSCGSTRGWRRAASRRERAE